MTPTGMRMKEVMLAASSESVAVGGVGVGGSPKMSCWVSSLMSLLK